MEVRIGKEKLWAKKPKPVVDYKVADVERNGVDEIRTMYELMVLAMQTDSSRVFTYRQPLGGLLKAIGLTANPHELSHWGTSEANVKANFQRELKQTELLSHFFDRLKETKDVDGSRIFDNCLVSYGSNIRSGHGISNVPAFIAGNIDNRLKHGQHRPGALQALDSCLNQVLPGLLSLLLALELLLLLRGPTLVILPG